MPLLLEIKELRQFHGDKIRLGLSLRPFAAHGVAFQRTQEVVLVRAVERVAHQAFARPPIAQNRFEFAALAVRLVFNFHLLDLLTAERGIHFLENRTELLRENTPRGVDNGGIARHHHFQNVQHRCVRLVFLLQQSVALLEATLVADKGFEIRRVVLRNHLIHKLSPLLAAARNKFRVRG